MLSISWGLVVSTMFMAATAVTIVVLAAWSLRRARTTVRCGRQQGLTGDEVRAEAWGLMVAFWMVVVGLLVVGALVVAYLVFFAHIVPVAPG